MNVYSAVRWSAAGRYGDQLTRLAVTVILAWFLAPADYGLMGMATVVTGFLAVFRNIGITKAIVQMKDVSRELLSSLFYVGLGAGLLLWLVLLLIAPMVSVVFDDARVAPIVSTIAFSFILAAPGHVPLALLTRRLAFRRLALVDISAALAYGSVTIGMAMAGWQVWALVGGALAASATSTLLLYILSAWRPSWCFHGREIRRVLNFTTHLTGFEIFNYIQRNVDNILIGIFWGPAALGLYKLAYCILLYPLQAITGVLGRVLFPIFSQAQDDDRRLKNTYLRACAGIALIVFPVMSGLFVIADLAVNLVLGARWSAIVPLILIFTPIGWIQCIGATVGQLYLAKGRTDWLLRWGVASGLVRMVGFLIGVRWGIIGVAISYAITTFLLTYPSFLIPFRLVSGLRINDLIRSLAPYGATAVIMALLVGAGRLLLEQAGFSPAIVLAASIVLGMVSYTAILLCTKPPAVNDFLKLLPPPFAHYVKHRAASTG